MSAPPVILPPSWGEVLDRIRDSINDVLATSAPELPALPPPASQDWSTGLDRIDERLVALDRAVARAEQSATESDAALAQTAKELEDWAQAARILAAQAGGAVS
jgi:hypothetical protein